MRSNQYLAKILYKYLKTDNNYAKFVLCFKIALYSKTQYILLPRLTPNGSGPGTPTGPCAVPIKVGPATVEDRNSGQDF